MLKKKILSWFMIVPIICFTGLTSIQMIDSPMAKVEKKDNSKQISNFNAMMDRQVLVGTEVETEIVAEIEIEEEIIEEVIEVVEEVYYEPVQVYSNTEDWIFEVSYYCACYSCTQNGNKQTASGAYAVEGVTIALPSNIPFGTTVYIEGVGTFTNQDRGGYIEYTYDQYGNTVMRVDVYLESHEECYSRGRHYSNGYIEYN